MAKLSFRSARAYTKINGGKKNGYQFRPKKLKDGTPSKAGYLDGDFDQKEVEFITAFSGIILEEK